MYLRKLEVSPVNLECRISLANSERRVALEIRRGDMKGKFICTGGILISRSENEIIQ